MSTIVDYIKWRGDLSFEQDGFNDFDNLVFSTIAYVDMDEIFERSSFGILSLGHIAREYFREKEQIYMKNPVLREAPNLMQMAAQSRRFSQILVRNYVNRINPEKTLQFAAMEFLLPDGSSYIAFRGTDDTIIGWKEDFMMAVSQVEAEREALDYFNGIVEDTREYRVGGHSKGGHLAVFVAALCEEEIRKHILRVYSNDGPGFSREFTQIEGFQVMADKVMRIIPEEAVVGMLMEPVGNALIVKSENSGIMQHNLMSWSMDGMRFVEAESISRRAQIIDRAVDEWLLDFRMEERKAFVEDLFAVLDASGVETISEIIAGGLTTFRPMTRRLNALAPNTREKVSKMLKGLFVEWENGWKEKG